MHKSSKNIPLSLKSKNLISDFGVNSSKWKLTLLICVDDCVNRTIWLLEINNMISNWHFITVISQWDIFFYRKNFKSLRTLSSLNHVCRELKLNFHSYSRDSVKKRIIFFNEWSCGQWKTLFFALFIHSIFHNHRCFMLRDMLNS